MLTEQRKMAFKAMYAFVGAPMVLGRKFMDLSTKLTADAKDQFEEFAKEGKKISKQVRDRNVVEEITHRVDLEHIQGRVEKLRDQLEGALENWRDSFNPAPAKPATRVPVTEPAAATKPAVKKAPARKPAAKATTAKKAPARRVAVKKAPARKPAAKATTK